ncbi:S8 family serine peptidase [Pseudobacillus badius]|uniref:S8 family serine peptidase n=1 Tax=Bacillus badius TaxID=1455 RepID=UPI001CBD35FF|nr:S8 family serine peptidase [Bacillus badius]UAT30914.1 S8 family serine peptidase [Bacillus badius]GLY11656.1 hypothetical protein Bbad01_28720 [Bacillus badius]
MTKFNGLNGEIDIKRAIILAAFTLTLAAAYYFISKDRTESAGSKELVVISETDAEDIDVSKREYSSWAYRALMDGFTFKKDIDYSLKIAILDSGIDGEHPDLAGRVKKEYNALDDGAGVRDEFGHGTAVAGVIAASHNDTGIKGMNPLADIYSVKVSNDKGVSEVASLVKGIEWCMKEKVDLMNISLGLSRNSEELERAVNQAIDAGIVIVAAAGNNYMTGTDYPAQYPKVLSVNAVTHDYAADEAYAGYGKIDAAAPGESILTTVPGGGYKVFSGTSMAAAYTTGMVSLIMSENKSSLRLMNGESRVDETFSLLKRKAIPLGDEKSYGMGFIKY